MRYSLKLIAATVVAASLSQGAFAADIPLKARPDPVIAPIFSWSGFYIGANVGGGIGQNRTTDTANFSAPGTVAAISPGIINPALNSVYTNAPAGALAGGQIGYNWQSGNWVIGVEADWDWTNQRNTSTTNTFIASSTSSNFAQLSLSHEQRMNWLATARARLGQAHGSSLWYVTGGGAWADLEANYAFSGPGAAPGGGVLLQAVPAVAKFSTTKAGWTVGAGVETSLGFLGWGDKWSLKAEYLYVDLGSVTNTFSTPNVNGTARYNIASTSEITHHIVRAGLNYRFWAGR